MTREEILDFYLRWAWVKLAKLYNSEAERRGITLSIGYALLSIEKEGTPSTKLGPRMGMESTSLSRTLKGMEEKGLIERKPNPADGRSVLVFLTPFGIEKRRDAKAAVIGFNQQVFDRFNPSELETFFKVITGIETMLQENKLATQELK